MKIFVTFFLWTLWLNAQQSTMHAKFEARVHQFSDDLAVLGITLTPDDHWHTYWSNPGDAGMTLRVALDDESLTIHAEEFPLPKRFEVSGIVGYGYEKPATFLYRIKGDIPKVISGKANWLTCDEDGCVPGSETFDLTIDSIGEEVPLWINEQIAMQPKDLVVPSKISKTDSQWTVQFEAEKDLEGWMVFPYDSRFSEADGLARLIKENGKYLFHFDFIGQPEIYSRFLITNGKEGYNLIPQ